MASGSAPTACSAAMQRGLGLGVIDDALKGLGAHVPTLAIVQVSAPGDPLAAGRTLAQAGAAIRDRHPACVVIGASAHGVIAGGDAVELEPAISVWCASLPGAAPRPFRIAAVPIDNGAAMITGLPDIHEGDRLAILLADPWSIPIGDVVDAFGSLPVAGGLASGARARGETRLLLNNAVLDTGCVGVVLESEAPVRVVVSQGCRPIGLPMTVTSASGNRVESLAGLPALAQIRDVVNALDPEDQALAVRGLHIGIARDPAVWGDLASDFVIRGILGADPETGAVTVGDDVLVGSVVRLHLRDADSADEDLRTVMALAPDGASGAYLFTCNGRGRSMFPTPAHDGDVVREALRTDGIGGFFAAGEIGPVGGVNHLHGFTAVVLVVGAGHEGDDVEWERPDSPPVAAADLDEELKKLLGG